MITDYILEDCREARRLAGKVDGPAWVATYLSGWLRADDRVLDVGCGPGVIVQAVAQAYPRATVIGVDASAQRISRAHDELAGAPNASAQLGSILALPFPDEYFDFIYCRLLLEYIADRHKAVAELVRVCRPGGHILLQDLDGQLVWHYPPDPLIESELSIVLHALQSTGFDPFIGRKLYHFVNEAGLTEISVDIAPYHLIAGRIDDRSYESWKLKLQIAFPLIESALQDQNRAARLKDKFLDYLRNQHTLTYSNVFTVVSQKP